MSVRINQRWPEGLYGSLVATAKRRGTSATEITVRAVAHELGYYEENLEPDHEVIGQTEDGRDLVRFKEPPDPALLTNAEPAYRCPVNDCEWRGATSPAAKCPHHGRTVVLR